MPEKPQTISDDIPVVVLQGDDELTRGDVLSDLTARFQTGAWGDMNIVQLDGTSVSRGDFSNAVNALPLGGGRRLIILRKALDFTSNKDAQNFLMQIIEQAPETTQMVMVFNDFKKYQGGKMRWQKAGGSHWLRKAFKKSEMKSQWLEFPLPSDREMPGWVRAEAERQGGKFEGAAAAELARLIGSNTLQARHEITKALDYVNREREVTRDDVRLLCAPSAEDRIFDLIDSMAARDSRSALAKYSRLTEHANPQYFQYVLTMIARQVRMLIITRDTLDGGGNLQEVQSAAGASQWLAKKLIGQSRRFEMAELLRMYQRLDRMDEDGKTGRGTLEVGMESLIAEISRQ